MSEKPLIDASDLGKLQAQLGRYAQATGKSMEDVLAKEAREMSYTLWDTLRRISPRSEAMLQAAKARSWRMKRVSNKLTPSVGNWVSRAAHERAKELLAGDKSDYFRVRVSPTSAMIVRRVRLSARRQLKTRTRLSRLLIGGRRNNRYATGALRAKDVSRHELTMALKADPSIKQLNTSQLAVTLELAYRQRAAMGSTMAMQWLPRVYKRRTGLVKRGPLVVNAKRGQQMGRVDFDTDRNGLLSSITLSGQVPGTASVMAKYDVFPRVVSQLIADREIGIKKALADSAQKAFRSALKSLK